MIRGLVRAVLAICLATATASAASAGHTDVTISTAPTHNMALVGGVYSPTGDRAVLNVNDLMTALNAGNLEVTTGSGRGKESGDIVAEAAFHWASANGLTLDAFHSIRVDAPVTDAGTGALTLTTNDGGTNGHLQFGSGGNIALWGLANALTINGQPYTLVNSVASLAAAISANPSGSYALVASYDAAVDKTYRQDPIATTFEGNFEGLGNAISNVSIRMTGGDIGFFNTIGANGSVSDFRLRNINIFQPNVGGANVGGLAALSNGSLFGDEVSGSIVSHYAEWLGGLIGTGSTGSISHCSSTVSVIAPHWGPLQGGGGLAGGFGGSVIDSYATGDVKGTELPGPIGGLVGSSWGPIVHSHATGNVTAPFGNSTGAGGLAGSTSEPVSDSYATGDVTAGRVYAGGLVGSAFGPIIRSFATGNVPLKYTGLQGAGGLVGESTSTINDSYATGTPPGEWQQVNSGGLVGYSDETASIATSYATGKALGQGGGFICAANAFELSNDYWDTTMSGTIYGVCNNTNIAGVTGLTTTQLQAGLPAGFDPKIWAEDRKINHGLPYLIANPPQ